MQSLRVLEILSGLARRKDPGISPEEIAFLREEDLISVLSQEDYDSKSGEAASLFERQSSAALLEDEVEKLRKQSRSAKRKLNSCIFRACSRIRNRGNAGLDRLKAKFASLLAEVGKKETELKSAKARVNELCELKKHLKNFFQAGGHFFAITENGADALKQLVVREPRLKNIGWAAFKRGLELVRRAVQERYQRFKEAHLGLAEMDFDEYDEYVVRFAMSLSSNTGEIKDILSRAAKFWGLFKKEGWDDYENLKTIAALVPKEGTPKELVRELKEIHEIMQNEGSDDDYATLYEAQLIMDISGKNSREKYGRFSALQNALDKEGWDGSSHLPCCIAAKLARYEEEAECLTRDFSSLKLKLVKRRFDDCDEADIAALILFGQSGTPDDRADKCFAALMALAECGWDDEEPENYPRAATVSLMPGTLAENVLILRDACGMLEADDFDDIMDDVTALGMQIMAGRFRYLKGLLAEIVPELASFDPEATGHEDDGFGLTDLLVIMAIANMMSDDGLPLDASGAVIEGLTQVDLGSQLEFPEQLDSVTEGVQNYLEGGTFDSLPEVAADAGNIGIGSDVIGIGSD